MKRISFHPAYLVWAYAVLIVLASAAGWFDSFAVLVWSIVAAPVALLLEVLWKRPPARHWLLRDAVTDVAVLIVIVSVALRAWPLKLSFAASRHSIEHAAVRLQQGDKVTTPVQLGFFRVRKAEVRNGIVCLWTDLDPSGYTGLVMTTPAGAGSNFNLWSDTNINDRWQLISED